MTDTRIRLSRDVYDRLIQTRGLKTIDEQVQLTGVPRRTLYRILKGQPPSLSSAMRIADALGVPLAALFERGGGEA